MKLSYFQTKDEDKLGYLHIAPKSVAISKLSLLPHEIVSNSKEAREGQGSDSSERYFFHIRPTDDGLRSYQCLFGIQSGDTLTYSGLAYW